MDHEQKCATGGPGYGHDDGPAPVPASDTPAPELTEQDRGPFGTIRVSSIVRLNAEHLKAKLPLAPPPGPC